MYTGFEIGGDGEATTYTFVGGNDGEKDCAIELLNEAADEIGKITELWRIAKILSAAGVDAENAEKIMHALRVQMVVDA